ncbi:MAG: hypothetical protein IJ617_08330 [Oscillospiraceae bacterium]|nr:hypothetical protein [Oscillospiraceae bacterium]
MSRRRAEADKPVDFSAAVGSGAKLGLRMTMTLIPIAMLAFSFIWFRAKYRLTDEKVEAFAAQVKELRGKNK